MRLCPNSSRLFHLFIEKNYLRFVSEFQVDLLIHLQEAFLQIFCEKYVNLVIMSVSILFKLLFLRVELNLFLPHAFAVLLFTKMTDEVLALKCIFERV